MARSSGSGDLSPAVVVTVLAFTILIVGLVGFWYLKPPAVPVASGGPPPAAAPASTDGGAVPRG